MMIRLSTVPLRSHLISAAHLDHHQVPDSPQQTTTTVEKDGPPIASPITTEQTASNFRQSAEDPQQQSVPQPENYDRKL